MPEALRLPGYSANYVAHMSTTMSTRTIAGIAVPSSPVINAALEFARAHLETWLYNHVVRSWVLGTAIADRIPRLANRDREVHSVAAILHDMGCAKDEQFVSKDKPYEVDSANAAWAFVERHTTSAEWNRCRKQLLWDAVALQTSAPIAMHKQPEVVATTLGIMTDFAGPSVVPGNVLTTLEWRNIVTHLPRTGLKNGVVQKLCGFCRTKPETTYNTPAGDFGDQLVEGYSRIGHRWYDFLANPVDAD